MSKPLEILLVEDNEGDVELTRQVLRGSEVPCNLSIVNDGLEALEFLYRRNNFSAAPTPSFILLDLNMPRMDGKQFLELAKQDTRLKAIPVIIFTSSSSPMDIRDCYERQASCYVVKAFGVQEFGHALQQVVAFWGNVGRLPLMN